MTKNTNSCFCSLLIIAELGLGSSYRHCSNLLLKGCDSGLRNTQAVARSQHGTKATLTVDAVVLADADGEQGHLTTASEGSSNRC